MGIVNKPEAEKALEIGKKVVEGLKAGLEIKSPNSTVEYLEKFSKELKEEFENGLSVEENCD